MTMKMGVGVELLQPMSREAALEEYCRLDAQHKDLAIRMLQLKQYIFGFQTVAIAHVELKPHRRPIKNAPGKMPSVIEVRIGQVLREYAKATVKELSVLTDGQFSEDSLYGALDRMIKKGIARKVAIGGQIARSYELCVYDSGDQVSDAGIGTKVASSENPPAPAK